VLSMQLGLKEPEVAIQVSKAIRKSPRFPDSRHPRYTINAYGCGPEVYKAATNKGQWAALLATYDFRSEHDRQTPRIIDVINRMKPDWASKGKLWYDWMETPPGDGH